jgi:hypothetical protein
MYENRIMKLVEIVLRAEWREMSEKDGEVESN